MLPKPNASPVLLAVLVACGCSSPSSGSVAPGAGSRDQVLLTSDGHAVELPVRRPLGRGEHLMRAPTSLAEGAITIRRESGFTLDLDGVTLRGTPPGTDPDENRGAGIVLEGCEDVLIRGGRLGGYKGCLVLRDCRRVTIEEVEFEGWYGQRLLSTTSAESPADWLSPHENDEDQWLSRYGGAISATDCEEVTIRDCRGREGQNGILLNRTNGSKLYDNDFSFLSGWGLAMYRSSRNIVSHNCFDYCVRGYSHERYWRGQDSAGILMFERCSDNVIAFNSVTHGGDGIFLYGGQDIVEGRGYARGERHVGGSDRNLFYGNDLSYAVANSLEATFSSHNVAVANELSGSHQHGVWGGYSNGFLIYGNRINGTIGGAITIEHGQDCLIMKNEISDNEIGVELYWDEDPDLVGGAFGAHNDTRSAEHWIFQNDFADNIQDLVLKSTQGVTFSRNRFSGGNRRLYLDGLRDEEDPSAAQDVVAAFLRGSDGVPPSGHVSNSTVRQWRGEGHPRTREVSRMEPPDVPGERDTSLAARDIRGGLSTIVMGKWGPWDFPSGAPRPEPNRPGGLLRNARWKATWFAWSQKTHDPRADLDAWRALRFEALMRRTVGNWMDPWGDDEVRAAVGDEHFGLVASTEVTIATPGRYRLSVTSDDGVRVMVDRRVAFEDWTWHAPRRESVVLELRAGRHEIGLEYFQIDGAVALMIELDPVE